ncbi:putative DNA invertase [Xenorhabdus mauleonii]|uniref:DNA invertase n=1 Tax=Xenorhabdus mauleonii TaxID=351675 RepID=A0A1I3V585_9GAMM|nr:recombinase family protein [Xenorhabdus mauleonii]PHM37598.1 putative DNA invertase [Xenorhabdus mauleonii]SFJ89337.1 Site-specific DNA recombinase [Xenorhabdus mauleonii]
MKLGYVRVSKNDGSQTLDLQVDALIEAGVEKEYIYQDYASGKLENRPGLESCLKALRQGDILLVWKLDRLGRDLKHLINTVYDLSERQIGFKVLTGQGADIDTTTASGKLIFGVFAALAEFEREQIRERTIAGLKSARARGRQGGRKFLLTKTQVRLAQVAMKNKDTTMSELCRELNISRQSLYRYIGPNGELRAHGKKVLGIVET